MSLDVFTSREDLPSKTEDPDFWRLVSDRNTKKCFVLLILNELRKYDDAKGSPTRTLAKLKGWQESIDLMTTLAGEDDSSLPSDDPFIKVNKAKTDEE